MKVERHAQERSTVRPGGEPCVLVIERAGNALYWR
jgi:hypothetical protein